MKIVLKDIHKHFGPVKANNGISLAVLPGTIHGVLGENGAGKSTLMKILAGYLKKTSGTILADNIPVDFRKPAHALNLGIGMLYQEPLDFPLLSVIENFMLGQLKGVFLPVEAWAEKFLGLTSHLGFELDPYAGVSTLTIGERQQLEMIRLLSLGTKLLILDEPTTGISALQKELLFNALITLKKEGKSVFLVSHKLKDVDFLCDRITILRKGMVAGNMEAPFDEDEVLEKMFGTLPAPPVKTRRQPGEKFFMMENVQAKGGRTGLKKCNIVVRKGEKIGLAGLEGSGQGVLLRTGAGIIRPDSGSVIFLEKRMEKENFLDFQKKGVFFLPSDRLAEGLLPGLTITEHTALSGRDGKFWVKWDDAKNRAIEKIKKFRMAGRPELPVEALSGGNQQRLLLSFLDNDPKLLFLENPTRGLDVESARWVWNYLDEFCKKGTAIVFSSSELDEILMVADRIFVFYEGRIIMEKRAEDTDVNALGRAIAGRI